MRVPLHWLLWLRSRFDRTIYLVEPQSVRLSREFAPGERILDLGGGGEGVIGFLYGSQVVAVDISKEELDETPAGPLKIVADARDLPFEDQSFDRATAFYFFMYLCALDLTAVFRETFRVLRSGAAFDIWDSTIPPIRGSERQLFVVPVKVALPQATIQTAYGVRWKDRVLSADDLTAIAASAGFSSSVCERIGGSFHIRFLKP